LNAYWYGTKNSVTDVSGALAGTVPNSFSFNYDVGQAGSTYTRYAVIRDYTGAPACTTNTTTTQILPPATTCSLAAPSSVTTSYLGPASATFTIATSGSGLTAYWYGTKNSVTDVTNVLAGAVPNSFPFSYDPTQGGTTYTRYAVLRNSVGTPVCTTNTVTTQILAPPTMSCSLSAPSSVTTSNSGPVPGTFTISSSVSGLNAYWYGTHNSSPDVSGALAGTVPNSFTFYYSTSQAGSTYTRYAVIRDYMGGTACTTNTTTTQILAPPISCSLAISANDVYPTPGNPVNVTFTGTSNQSGLTAKWYGTNNSVVDANGAPAGSVPVNYTFPYDTSFSGHTFTRYLILYNGSTPVCTTNTVTLTVH
jgi:hypothetical protein